MHYHSPSQTAALLPYPALALEIAAVLRDLAATRVDAPSRMGVDLGGGNVLLLMPATDLHVTVVKLVSVHGSNTARGLPTIQGDVMALETATGRRLGLWDGATVTGRRTAALSLLAAQTLAPEPSGPLLLVGAGTQAQTHLEAFQAGLGTQRVYVASRTPQKAQQLVEHAQSLGMKAEAIPDPTEAIAEVSLIACTTTSSTPVIHTPLKPNQMLCAVGSFKPEVSELAPAVFEGAKAVVDLLETARHEAGDVIQAIAAGKLGWEEVKPLLEYLERTPKPSGPVIFKSVGHAAFDLAAVRLMLRDSPASDH